ncbi:ATP-dependent zinc metalloprotease FtsH [Marinicella pacifica]|uniref:ATP-dependent zinc metalloprotease FtsH n=1 Tax=Marinicella pacifica TaxID=1171543 RepID=A0A917CGJ3_9GAMM|nr:ATP-dependent zinc metalloprotease FtsH [Marinicella pacifica]
MNNITKNLLLWVVVLMVLMSVFGSMVEPPANKTDVPYSDFIKMVQNGQIEEVVIDPETSVHRKITAVTSSGEQLTVQAGDDPHLEDDLILNDVKYSIKAPQQDGWGWRIFETVFPILLFIGLFFLIMRHMQGGGGKGGAMSFGKSKAKLLSEESAKVTFADMAGAEEAKEEVTEVVDFLKDPTKFNKLGGKIPRGILMVGPPGTGKTLLARAIAGEAKVPFFSISGSDFVEMFVGVGASRVRDMFEQAKKNAPCIIFIDEIDAVGRQRGAGLGGGHDEREQTLNQLLVEMDGFEGNDGVIVIAATNRPDVLDPALLRPGRFDRQVVVPLPDIQGREAILKVHMKKVPLADDVKPGIIARGTPGFSGADLANLVNEAALFAAREDATEISMEMFDKARDKIMMGAERRSMVMKESEKRNTAYHEAGHAIVGLMVPEHDPVYKVTIIPRGRALGVTMFLPEEDKYSYSKTALESQISSLYGGRIAEEIIGGPDAVTTGASNDIERATDIAKNMVTKWGLSDALGPLTYSEDEGEVFLGRQVTQHKNMSDTTADKIDKAVRDIIDRNYKRAEKILKENLDKLHLMAQALIKYETIDSKQIAEIMEGKEPSPPVGWQASDDDEDGGTKPPKKTTDPKQTGFGDPAEQT